MYKNFSIYVQPFNQRKALISNLFDEKYENFLPIIEENKVFNKKSLLHDYVKHVSHLNNLNNHFQDFTLEDCASFSLEEILETYSGIEKLKVRNLSKYFKRLTKDHTITNSIRLKQNETFFDLNNHFFPNCLSGFSTQTINDIFYDIRQNAKLIKKEIETPIDPNNKYDSNKECSYFLGDNSIYHTKFEYTLESAYDNVKTIDLSNNDFTNNDMNDINNLIDLIRTLTKHDSIEVIFDNNFVNLDCHTFHRLKDLNSWIPREDKKEMLKASDYLKYKKFNQFYEQSELFRIEKSLGKKKNLLTRDVQNLLICYSSLDKIDLSVISDLSDADRIKKELEKVKNALSENSENSENSDTGLYSSSDEDDSDSNDFSAYDTNLNNMANNIKNTWHKTMIENIQCEEENLPPVVDIQQKNQECVLS